MGSKKIVLLLLFFSSFTSLNLIQSSYALHVRTLLPGSNKIARGGGGHGGESGGSSHGGADNGNGGNNGQGAGGAAVIPVVVAGAANNNRHHKRNGAATRNCITLPILIVINMASYTFLRIRVIN